MGAPLELRPIPSIINHCHHGYQHQGNDTMEEDATDINYETDQIYSRSLSNDDFFIRICCSVNHDSQQSSPSQVAGRKWMDYGVEKSLYALINKAE
jgi:hypothetical protein